MLLYTPQKRNIKQKYIYKAKMYYTKKKCSFFMNYINDL